MLNRLNIDHNPKARHLIFGDIHGRYDDMMKLLDHVGYDPDVDYVYSVGDMIDRGFKNTETVLFFTSHPNRFAVLGNHELMFMDAITGTKGLKDYYFWFNNGGYSTAQELKLKKIHDSWLFKNLEDLPFILHVDINDENYNGFRIMHGEFPSNLNEGEIEAIMASDNARKFLIETTWSRKGIYMHQKVGYTPRPEQTITTFSGHSFVEDVTNIGNRYYIDLGMENLCMIDALTKEVYKLSDIENDY